MSLRFRSFAYIPHIIRHTKPKKGVYIPYFFGGFGIGVILSTQFCFELRTIPHCLRESKAFCAAALLPGATPWDSSRRD